MRLEWMILVLNCNRSDLNLRVFRSDLKQVKDERDSAATTYD
ncbi:unnamed protein product [Rhodiola kirilowii]